MNFTECKKPENWGGEWWQSPKKACLQRSWSPHRKKENWQSI